MPSKSLRDLQTLKTEFVKLVQVVEKHEEILQALSDRLEKIFTMAFILHRQVNPSMYGPDGLLTPKTENIIIL